MIDNVKPDVLDALDETIPYIREHVEDTELLAQLAEECAELAQAALKYRRVLDGRNPTPMSVYDATHNLLEEMGDVALCLTLLIDTEEKGDYVNLVEANKSRRWVRRLREAKRHAR